MVAAKTPKMGMDTLLCHPAITRKLRLIDIHAVKQHQKPSSKKF